MDLNPDRRHVDAGFGAPPLHDRHEKIHQRLGSRANHFVRMSVRVVEHARDHIGQRAHGLGTTNSELPLTPSGAVGVRANTRWMMFSVRSCSPKLMNIFCPWMR